MNQYLNEKEWQHHCQNGSNFTCARCDFREPIVVTNWPRSQSGELDGEAFASDVAEMIGFHATNVLGDNQLDPKQGFRGYDCIRWELK